MEINTALMLYKSYVRSVMEYGLFVYYPRDWKGKETMEKLQYKGLRIAMGYRNSTPTNVMLAESRILRMEERAGYLARNYWTRVIANEDKEMEGKMNRLEIIDCRYRHVRPAGTINIFIESWRDSRSYKKQIEKCGMIDIYGGNYWAMTNVTMVDLEIGEVRKNKKMKDEELMDKYREKYKLEDTNQIIFTDGSRQEGKKNTGIGIVLNDTEEAYKISLNKECSIFTAEAIAIEKALGIVQDLRIERDILILTDRILRAYVRR